MLRNVQADKTTDYQHWEQYCSLLASKQYKTVYPLSRGFHQNQGKGNHNKVLKGIYLSRPDEKIINGINW